LLVILGRQGDGPGWLLGDLLVVALSVVTVTARRTRREWMVLALDGDGGHRRAVDESAARRRMNSTIRDVKFRN
jgi:hypothetical protein